MTYRSGTGTSVLLAMSSVHKAHWWDMVTYNPADSKWYFDDSLSATDRNMKGFDWFCGENEKSSDSTKEDICAILEKVDPQTVSQRGTEWFLDRMFSLTSSTIDAAIQDAAPGIKPSDAIWPSFQKVLEYGLIEHLLLHEDHDDQEESEAASNVECCCQWSRWRC